MGMSKVHYNVPGISCGHCVHTIQMELAEIEGVRTVVADRESRSVEVEFEPPATESEIEALLAEINYPVAK